MPTYNGPLSFLIEVMLQVFWSYLVWSVLLASIFASLVLLLEALSGDRGINWLDPFLLVRIVALATLFIFSSFRIYFQPRFSYAPMLLTYAVAGVIASPILAGALIAGFYFDALHEIVELSLWFALNPEDALRMLIWSVAAIVGCSLLAALDYWGGSGARVVQSRHRWFGRILVGRDAFDAFVEKEAERLRKEYDDYVGRIRK